MSPPHGYPVGGQPCGNVVLIKAKKLFSKDSVFTMFSSKLVMQNKPGIELLDRVQAQLGFIETMLKTKLVQNLSYTDYSLRPIYQKLQFYALVLWIRIYLDMGRFVNIFYWNFISSISHENSYTVCKPKRSHSPSGNGNCDDIQDVHPICCI